VGFRFPRPVAVLALALSLARPAQAGDATIEVTGAWARPTLGQSRVVAAYATLRNRGPAVDKIVGIETDVARAAEIHATELAGDVMQMRRLEAVELAPGRRTVLKQGGTHIMLIDVVRPLKQGEQITLIFHFEHHPSIAAEATITLKPPPGPRGSHAGGG
jgi:hypothetical protein